jgi:hypothetical protein
METLDSSKQPSIATFLRSTTRSAARAPIAGSSSTSDAKTATRFSAPFAILGSLNQAAGA